MTGSGRQAANCNHRPLPGEKSHKAVQKIIGTLELETPLLLLAEDFEYKKVKLKTMLDGVIMNSQF